MGVLDAEDARQLVLEAEDFDQVERWLATRTTDPLTILDRSNLAHGGIDGHRSILASL